MSDRHYNHCSKPDRDRLIENAYNVIRLVNDSHRVSLVLIARKVDQRMDDEQRDLEEAEIARGLVLRIRSGDTAAESELAQRYGERLRYVLGRQMAQYPDDVDDIVQESLTTAILNLRQKEIDNPAQLGGYIYGIARNLRLARIRDHIKHDGASDPELISSIPDEQVLPDQIIASTETTQIVRRLLAELGASSGTERDRQVLLRLYLHQQTKDEVCEALEIQPAHLRRVVHRAKQRLRKLFVDSTSTTSSSQAPHEQPVRSPGVER